MNYIGSKSRLLGFIQDTIEEFCGKDLSDKVFCDIFAGTGAVGRHFKPLCKRIISNDLEYYSYVVNRNYIGNNTKAAMGDKIRLMAKLNSLEPVEGFIYKNYCKGGHGDRQYFSDMNGKMIDAARTFLGGEDSMKDCSFEGSTDRYYWLLCSILESADRVANTTSIYGAYLKSLKKSAQKRICFESSDFNPIPGQINIVRNGNANDIIREPDIKGDILYMDPPYNHRQYGANYHLLTTIAKYDDFTPKGKTGIREYERSKYCMKNEVAREFEDLISNAKFKYIFMSYNNESIMPPEQIKSIMSKYGEYDVRTKGYQRYKADSNRFNAADSVVEYIHVLVKD